MGDVKQTPQGNDDPRDLEGVITDPDEGKGGEGAVDEGQPQEPGQEPKEGGEPQGEPTVEELLAQRDAEVRELRSLLREQKREMTELRMQMQGTSKALKDAGVLDEGEESEEQKRLLQQQEALRAQQLETMLEMMRLNPRYEDVDEVVSQEHFDDMVEAMAEVFAERTGVSKGEAVMAVEDWIWSQPNPYKLMYAQIKQHHPDYAKQPPKGGEPKGPAKAPSSLQAMAGGGGASAAGWTAAKIDALPEDELDKVPRDVYALYLQGKLK